MDDYLTVLAVLVSCTSVGLVLWSGRRKAVSPVLTLAWAIYGILWCVCPLVLRLWLGSEGTDSDGPVSWEALAILQAGLMLVLVLAHLGVRDPVVSGIPRLFDKYAPLTTRLIWPTAAAFVALIAVEVGMNRLTGGTFGEVTAFSLTADSAQLARIGLLETLLGFLVSYALALLSLGRRAGVTRGVLTLAWALVLIHSGFSLLRGLRSVALLPLVAGLIAFTALQGRARVRAGLAVGALGIVTLLLGAPIAGVLGLTRTSAASGLSVDLIRDGYAVVLGDISGAARFRLLAGEVNRKFDAISPGVELLALEPPGTGGMRPLLSAAVAPIPRIVYPTKPVPTSRDGTYLGTPYRIAAQAYGDPEIGMVVPVSAPAIALWELGLVGLLVLLLMNLVNLLLVNSFLVAHNVVLRALGISLLGLPTSEFFVGPPSSLLRDDLRLVVLAGALAAVSMVLYGAARRGAPPAVVGLGG